MPYSTASDSRRRAPSATAGARRIAVAATASLAAVLASSACRQPEDPNLVRLNGRIEATQVDIAPKVTGRVIEVRVREGDRVKAGDLLVRLDLGETVHTVDREKANVDAAQARVRDLEAGSRPSEIAGASADVSDRRAALALAQKELERQQFLLARKVGTERDLDRAKTDLDRARAALDNGESRLRQVREGARQWQVQGAQEEVARARAQLAQQTSIVNEAELRAPADALIIHRLVEPGQLVAAGQSSLTLAFTDRLFVRTFVPETKLGRVKQGQAAEITVDAFADRIFKGRVAEIAADAEFTPKAVETREERINLVYGAKVDLDGGWNVPLVPGQPAEVLVRLK